MSGASESSVLPLPWHAPVGAVDCAVGAVGAVNSLRLDYRIPGTNQTYYELGLIQRYRVVRRNSSRRGKNGRKSSRAIKMQGAYRIGEGGEKPAM